MVFHVSLLEGNITMLNYQRVCAVDPMIPTKCLNIKTWPVFDTMQKETINEK